MAEAKASDVPLADFVCALREELKKAQASSDSRFPIEVGPITVEFTVVTRREGGASGGVKFWVVNAGVSGTLANESSQKVTMQLQPLAPGGGKVEVADDHGDAFGRGREQLADDETS